MREHILVVEDAPEFQHLHRESLSKAGYSVPVAGDGARALEIARSMNPVVIILDLVLPDVDGMDLCAEFRKFTDAYIIMVTSRSDEVDKPASSSNHETLDPTTDRREPSSSANTRSRWTRPSSLE